MTRYLCKSCTEDQNGLRDGDIGPLRDPNDHSDIGMPMFQFVPERPRHDFPFGELWKWIALGCALGVILGIVLKIAL